MQYYSTNNQAPEADFKQAVINGLAPDKGLYFPESIPQLSPGFLKKLKGLDKEQIAYEVIRPYVGNAIPEEELYRICSETVSFEFPLIKVSDDIYSLELFHGPTLAFKDVGARFLSRCLGYFYRNTKQKITVLVATSGDTGGAVANGFFNVPGIQVVILYPSGKVSKIQELQLTTLGNNITALEVKGTFDDCQNMVKQALNDKDLNNHLSLTSANSINIARWLSQQFYYFYALQQWPSDTSPVICVPSGNFGNICAGLLAQASGLGVRHFIAACNSNKVFPRYINTGKFEPEPVVATISNAMDVANPSNFNRILELFEESYPEIKKHVSSYSIDDAETIASISDVQTQYNYLLDPHGAVAWRALENYIEQNPGEKGIILETAHPVKFEEVIKKIVVQEIAIPPAIKELLLQPKHSILLNPVYNDIREFLLSLRY